VSPRPVHVVVAKDHLPDGNHESDRNDRTQGVERTRRRLRQRYQEQEDEGDRSVKKEGGGLQLTCHVVDLSLHHASAQVRQLGRTLEQSTPQENR